MSMPVQVQGRTPVGFLQMTSLGSAVGFTSIPAGAKLALVQAEDQIVRWRDDATNPTASVGMYIPVDDMLVYDGNLNTIRFIEEVAGGKLNISFYA